MYMQPDQTSTDPATNPTPNRIWFKVFNDVLHDMVFITMPDALLGTFVRLLALANTTRNVGLIYGDAATIAMALRLPLEDAERSLQELDRLGLVIVEDGVVGIADDRYYTGRGLRASDSREAEADRQRKHRDAVKAARNQISSAAACHSDESRPRRESDESRRDGDEPDQSSTLPNKKEETTRQTTSAETDTPGLSFDEFEVGQLL